MRIIFVHHSCFVVEISDNVLIFDYFDGSRVDGWHFTGELPVYESQKKIYMFASHSHRDHFDWDILRWADRYPNIRYILSKDIRISSNFLKKHGIDPEVRERVTFVAPDHKYRLEDLQIETLRSTDAGVAFYVNCGGMGFYHAGDLNDWRWEGAGDLINGKMQRDYRFQIRKLSGKPIFAAFVPLDPRLLEHQCLGMMYFLEKTDARHIFPMHMWQDYSGIQACKKRISNGDMADRIVEITQENQVFPFGEI